jgi:MFS family permease
VRRLLLSACALRFLDSFVLIAPFYTVMFAERGLVPAQIGVVLASWSVMGVVLEVPCGVLADRVSRRWLLAVAQLLRCMGFLVWIAFPNFWGFLVGLMLWGMKSATLSGAFEALVYDELKAAGREVEYARIYGRTQSARFGGVLAASLLAAVAAPLGYDALNLASFAAGLAAAASALTLPGAPKALSTARSGYFAHLARGAREAASLPGVPSLLLFIAAMQAVVYACADYWQLFGQEVGLSKPGIALFMAGLYGVGVVTAALAHRLRAMRLRSLHLLLIAAGACVVAAAATFQTWSIVLPMAFVALYWLVDVNADARFQHALRPETRATVASVKGFVMQCGTSLLMLGFGLVAQAASYRAAFLSAGAAAMLIGAGWYAAPRLRSPPAPRPR